MKIINLASGSKGNATLIKSEKRTILIDQGLTFKELKSRLTPLGIEPESISAIFVTHEHGDHIKGISSFVKNCPYTYIYVHLPILNYVRCKYPEIEQSKIIAFENVVTLDDLVIKSFDLSHDSIDCVGYQVSEGKNKIAIATDLGYFDENVLRNLACCSLVIVEANHDVNMLINSRYPIKTKSRILSSKGHLSNDQTAELVYLLSQFKVKQVILAHLSEQNNNPLLAYSTVCAYLSNKNVIEGKDIYIDVASQRIPTRFFVVD